MSFPRCRLLPGLAVVVLVIAGCGDDPVATAPRVVDRCRLPGTAGAGTGERVVVDGARERTVLVARPDPATGPTPTVVALHGHGGRAADFEATTGLARTGTTRGVTVVTPQAEGDPRRWNFDRRPDGADDFAFVAALVDDLIDGGCAEEDRVFVVGSSNGAAFAGFLACAPPYRFAAVAMVIATVPSGCPTDVTPSILTIRGTADDHVRYPGTPEMVAGDAAHHGCGAEPEAAAPRAGVERLRWTGCRGGSEVELLTVVGGTHTWPGGTAATAPADRALSATDAVLDLFVRTGAS